MGALWGLSAALGFGTSDFIARFTSIRVGVTASLLATLAVGSVALTIWAVATGTPWPSFSGPFWLILVSGIANAFALLYLYQALSLGPINVAAPIAATYPAVILIGLIPFGIIPGPWRWVGVILTLGGVVLLARLSDEDSHAPENTSPAKHAKNPTRNPARKTILYAFAAMMLAAFGTATSQEAALTYSPLAVIWSGRSIGCVIILAGVIAFRQTISYPPVTWLPLIAQALLDAGGNFTLLLSSRGDGRPIAAVFASAFALVTVILARIILKEKIRPAKWGAIAIILAGVALLSWLE